MAKTKPHVEREEAAERYAILLHHFETQESLNMSALGRRIGRDRSTVSSGKTRGPSAEIRELFRDKLGVEPRYWTNAERLPPADCIVPTGAKASAAETRTAISRQNTIALAREDGASLAVIGAIASLDPPRGREDDAWWWVRSYREIVSRTGRKAG